METYVVIGTDIQTDKVVAIDAEARARSTYVIGITGCGKSNLLETMAWIWETAMACVSLIRMATPLENCLPLSHLTARRMLFFGTPAISKNPLGLILSIVSTQQMITS